MDRNTRRELQGKVISNKMEKTITVLVETYKIHPIYKKRIKTSKKYKVHDEKNTAQEGDKVLIMETRPLSKNKRFRLVKVLEKAVI